MAAAAAAATVAVAVAVATSTTSSTAEPALAWSGLAWPGPLMLALRQGYQQPATAAIVAAAVAVAAKVGQQFHIKLPSIKWAAGAKRIGLSILLPCSARCFGAD